MALTEKGKALSKWVPSGDYLSSYDIIFGKKEEKAEDELFIVAAKSVECPKPQPFTPETMNEAFAKIKEYGITLTLLSW